MKGNKTISIITIVCFATVILIPIGLVLMFMYTDWKKRIKFILSVVLTLLYIGIALLLTMSPSNNSSGIALPFNYSKGSTNFETNTVTSAKTDEDLTQDFDTERQSLKKDENELTKEPVNKLPSSVSKKKGMPARSFWIIMFFLFMLFLVIMQNMRNSKKGGYENPYVDVNQYKLPLTSESKIPLVHYLRVRRNADENFLYATKIRLTKEDGDLLITNKRVVFKSDLQQIDFPIPVLEAAQSISGSCFMLTSGDRKYYFFIDESQMKYALAVLRYAAENYKA